MKTRPTVRSLLAITLGTTMVIVTLMLPAPAQAQVEATPESQGSLDEVGSGGVYGLLGKTPDGEVFSYTWRQGDPEPTVPAQASAFCEFFVSDISYLGTGENSYFSWDTSHACTGAYGEVQHATQVYRSSWSGWRGYTPWEYSRWIPNSSYTYYWSARCHYLLGWYDYKAAFRIYATGIGSWSPTGLSDNTERRDCGPGMS